MLVAEPNPGARARLVSTLLELGACPERITSTEAYDEALSGIGRHRPGLVISEYRLGGRTTEPLAGAQRSERGGSIRGSVFIWVTSETSEAVAARAGEADVDGVILKPYAVGTLRKSLVAFALPKDASGTATLPAGTILSIRIDSTLALR